MIGFLSRFGNRSGPDSYKDWKGGEAYSSPAIWDELTGRKDRTGRTKQILKYSTKGRSLACGSAFHLITWTRVQIDDGGGSSPLPQH